jgi:hypothetical protein
MDIDLESLFPWSYARNLPDEASAAFQIDIIARGEVYARSALARAFESSQPGQDPS